MIDGASLKVEGCEIAGFTGGGGGGNSGITVFTPAKVTIVDTIVRDNNNGIWFDNDSTGDVARTTVVGNTGTGIRAYPTAGSAVTVTVTDSVVSNNGWGITALGYASRIANMTVSRSTASHNENYGFAVSGDGSALMVVSGSVASHNLYGFRNGGGTFRSLGDNTVFDNGANVSGAITLTAPI